MSHSIQESPINTLEEAEAFVERVFGSVVGLFDLAAVHIGDRLGLYRALHAGGPSTSVELAEATGTDERYVREWLEQQAVTDILVVRGDATDASERRYELPAGHAEALVATESPNYIAALGRQALGMLRPLPSVVEAFRTGAGVPYADYGPDTREGIADLNRVMFLNDLGSSWFPAIDDVHARLSAGGRLADLGCGAGWSSIAIATAYPNARVDGFDVDAPSIEAARKNAAAEGLDERLRFHVQDASGKSLGDGFDVVTIFEALHDLGRPVEALANARRSLAEDGVMIVADERVAETFTAPGDDVERIMYGFSVVHCLPVGRADHEDSAATGTAMRPETLREYAREAGFSNVDVLPIENDFWRFYRLDP
jgi:2-polyprenyl-3-methyl-5-hydroxy-6-metoxy-1,4-benzoquinol methylase